MSSTTYSPCLKSALLSILLATPWGFLLPNFHLSFFNLPLNFELSYLRLSDRATADDYIGNAIQYYKAFADIDPFSAYVGLSAIQGVQSDHLIYDQNNAMVRERLTTATANILHSTNDPDELLLTTQRLLSTACLYSKKNEFCLDTAIRIAYERLITCPLTEVQQRVWSKTLLRHGISDAKCKL